MISNQRKGGPKSGKIVECGIWVLGVDKTGNRLKIVVNHWIFGFVLKCGKLLK